MNLIGLNGKELNYLMQKTMFECALFKDDDSHDKMDAIYKEFIRRYGDDYYYKMLHERTTNYYK